MRIRVEGEREDGAGAGLHVRTGILVLVLLAATLVAIVHWRAGIPGVADLEGYLYAPRHRRLHPVAWLPLALALTVGAHALAWRLAPRRFALAAALAVAGGLGAQLYAAGLDGPGLGSVLYRFEDGHRDFLTAARVHRDRVPETLRAYEALATDRSLGLYAPSKPPGIHFVYALIDRVARLDVVRALVAPVRAQAEARPRLGPEAEVAAFAAVAFPFGSALCLAPLLYLARRLTGSSRRAVWAGVLASTTPAYVIFSGHTDGALFPLLAVLSAALALAGARERRPWWLVAAGAVWGFGCWTTFSLLPALGFVGATTLVGLGWTRSRRLAPRSVDVASFAFGVVLVVAVLAAFDFLGDPMLRFARATEYHQRWKGGLIGGRHALLGLAEWSVYLGLPMLLAWLAAIARGPARPRWLAALTALGVIALALLSGSCEVARIWLFVVPFVALAVAGSLPPSALALLTLANLVLVPVIRSSQGW